MSSELLEFLRSKPIGKPITNAPREDVTTRSIDITKDRVNITIPVAKGTDAEEAEGVALRFLQDKGQDPNKWVVERFSVNEYGDPTSPWESVKATFKPKTEDQRDPIDIDHLADAASKGKKHKPRKSDKPSRGIIIALGDMQFGKIDGDGVEGTIARTFGCIDQAATRIRDYANNYNIEHVLVAFLGDHIENFVSQGGANVWRTPLTLSEQIRLTRRTMMHALVQLGDLAPKVTMAAVPGNHGETVRFSGKGVTRYDDSHDTECLVAVAEAARQFNPDAFEHVEFMVPGTDEMTCVTDICGTRVGMVHGHQWRPGRHMEWWQGQAFGGSLLRDTNLMLAGHLHHEHIDTDGPRTFVQVPALESESTWWRHAKGTHGNPGVMLLVTHDGRTPIKELVQADVSDD